MSSGEDSGYYFGRNDKWYLSAGKILALCILTILVFLIYYYAWKTYRRHARESAQSSINEVSASQVLESHQQPINRGLHPSVISSLPTFVYKPEIHHKHINECPVCLSNLEEGEIARVIPTCKHMFHLQCINMWLFSHSTCPICRSPAQPSSTDDQYHEMSIWVVPSKGAQVNSISPATPSLEGTSSGASPLAAAEDGYLFGKDKSKKRIRPLG